MTEKERKELIEASRDGNYKPLIMRVIMEKWNLKQTFTWRSIYLELQEITEIEHNKKFAQSLRECLNDPQVEERFIDIVGTFVPSDNIFNGKLPSCLLYIK